VTRLRFLLDTNICIYIRRRRPPGVVTRFAALQPGEAALSVITYGELAFGCEKGPAPMQARANLEELVQMIPVMPMPADAGRIYGSIWAVLGARGEMIGANDLWIAAHALATDLTVVTNNEKEFTRVSGLKIQNWIK
jgi:tRNA(fMet)-specific endonuclease VapC